MVKQVSRAVANAWRAIVGAVFLCAAPFAAAEVTHIEVRQVAPAFGGCTFGTIGSYERVDAIAHFRVDPNHLLNAGIVASQTGRTIKELLFEFNEDERGRIVFDGLHINISGAGKNAVNSQFARPGQKDAQHGPSPLAGDEFPFTYAVMFDPVSRRTDGVLARCSGTKTCPKIIHADSENELWHGGALTFADGVVRDVSMPDNVRAYVFAATEHSASAQSAPPLCSVQTSTAIDWRPLNRALLFALEEWIEGRAPPASRYPRVSAGELVAPERVGFPPIPGIMPMTRVEGAGI